MPDDPDQPLPLDYAPAARRSITVAKIYNPIQAHFTANLLERAGIACIVLNANSNNLGAAATYAPCELIVPPEDADPAVAILADLAAGRLAAINEELQDPGAAPAQAESSESGDLPSPLDLHPLGDNEEDNAASDPRCPKCSSWQVRKYASFWHDFLRLLRLLPPPPPGRTEFECFRCSHRWIELVDLTPRKK